MKRTVLFASAGGVGFAVDLGSLTILIGAGLSAWQARALSIAAAMTVTFMINRALTFEARSGSWAAQLIGYAGISATSAALNWLVFVLLIATGLPVPLAAALGVSAGISLNYFGYARLVFARP